MLVAALATGSAHAISRVGTGIGDPTDGFRAELPMNTLAIENKDEQSLRVFISRVGSMMGDRLDGSPTFLEAMPFRQEYPGWTDRSRHDLSGYLVGEGWEKLEVSEACVEAWIGRSETASFAVTTWGDGKGAVFTGPKSYELEIYVRDLVRGIRLMDGACAWN